MARSSQQSTANMGSSTSPVVVEILLMTRNPEIWQHYDLCLMSDGSQKAQCKSCGKLMGRDASSTLRKYFEKFYVALRSKAGSGQTSMGEESRIWHYDLEMVRDRMTKYVIQEALPFDHFDNPRFTALVRDTLQPKYKQYTFILTASKALPKQCVKYGTAVFRYASRKSVGVRIPDDAVCQAVLEKMGAPLITTSVRSPNANQWIIGPVLIADTHEPEGLNFVIEAGVRVANPSIVVDMLHIPPKIVRQGKGPKQPWMLEEDVAEERD